jgi:hypothetical protein
MLMVQNLGGGVMTVGYRVLPLFIKMFNVRQTQQPLIKIGAAT